MEPTDSIVWCPVSRGKPRWTTTVCSPEADANRRRNCRSISAYAGSGMSFTNASSTASPGRPPSGPGSVVRPCRGVDDQRDVTPPSTSRVRTPTVSSDTAGRLAAVRPDAREIVAGGVRGPAVTFGPFKTDVTVLVQVAAPRDPPACDRGSSHSVEYLGDHLQSGSRVEETQASDRLAEPDRGRDEGHLVLEEFGAPAVVVLGRPATSTEQHHR